MKRRSFAKSALKKVAIAVMSLMLVALPAMAVAADDHAVVGAPPVSQPLVTEGYLPSASPPPSERLRQPMRCMNEEPLEEG